MAVNGISADYYPTGYVDKKETAEMPNGAEKTAYSKELSEAEEMAVFKKELKRIGERQIEICRKERLIVNAGQRHMVFTRTIFI